MEISQDLIVKDPGRVLSGLDTSRYGEYQVTCDPSRKPGWELIAVVYQDTIHYHDVSVPAFEPGSGGCNGYWTTKSLQHPVAERSPNFLMGRLREDTLAELNEENQDLNKKVEEAKKLAEEHAKKVKSRDDMIEAQKTSVETADKIAQEEREKRVDYEKRVSRLEADMAKVRKYVGEGKWKELVEEPVGA